MFRFFLAVAVTALMAQTEFQTEAEYREEMREIDHAFSKLVEERPTARGPDVEREAERLAQLFEDVEDFWIARGDEEAANFARMAKKTAPSVLPKPCARETTLLMTRPPDRRGVV